MRDRNATSLLARNENPPLIYWPAFSRGTSAAGVTIRWKWSGITTALAAIVLQNVKKQTCHFLFLEKRTPSVRDGRNKERADFLRSVFHFPPALKRIILNDPYAALKGRSSTGADVVLRGEQKSELLSRCSPEPIMRPAQKRHLHNPSILTKFACYQP
jgi:hypothetical protein